MGPVHKPLLRPRASPPHADEPFPETNQLQRCPLAIRLKARGGESVEGLMKRFKKLCEKEGLTKDIRKKEFYEKPSERMRRRVRKAIARQNRPEMPSKPRSF